MADPLPLFSHLEIYRPPFAADLRALAFIPQFGTCVADWVACFRHGFHAALVSWLSPLGSRSRGPSSEPCCLKAFLTSTSLSDSRHDLNLPSAVSRSLLHDSQKWLLMGLINPISPTLHRNGSVYMVRQKDAEEQDARGRSSQVDSDFVPDMNLEASQSVALPIGMYSMKRKE